MQMNPSTTATSPSLRVAKVILPPTLLCLVLLAFFLDKPFHVDDPLNVWIAGQIRAHPLDFFGFSLNWEGHSQPVSRFFENPPGAAFFLAGVSCLGGFRPIVHHCGLLPINAASIMGMVLLARRFCRRPQLAATLFLLCPAFLVSATSVMCEPLLICFWVWAVWLWIRGVDQRPSLLPVAGGVMLLAILTKFIAISLIPLAMLYLFCGRRPSDDVVGVGESVRWKTGSRNVLMKVLGLLIPVVGLLVYQAYTSHRYGSGALTGAAVYATGARQGVAVPVLVKLVNTLCFVGGCSVACVLFLPLVINRWIRIVSVLTCFAIVAWSASHLQPPPGWSSPRGNTHFAAGFAFFGQYAFWVLGGVGLLALTVLPLLRRRHFSRTQQRDDLFLLAWIIGIFVFTAFINWSINARSILPMLPALCIVVVRRLDAVQTLSRFRVVLVVILAAGLTLSVTRADYEQAVTIQMAADSLSQLAREIPGNSSDHPTTLWCAGHWGFQYYLQENGAIELDDLLPEVKPGDFIAVPTSAYGGMPGITGAFTLQHMSVGLHSWVATTHPRMGAEFYCSYGYGLPFILSPIPADDFYLLRATPQTHIHR